MKRLKAVNPDNCNNILQELNIVSIQDLRKYILYEWLKLSNSEDINIKIQALKEISRYLFGNHLSIGNELTNENPLNLNFTNI